MLIIAIILFGMLAGAAAQLVVGKPAGGIDWSLALVAGLVGSFVGAIIVTAGWFRLKRRTAAPTP
ncbi:MAG: integral rane protein [Aeromicrobium sp.]|jgi:uncharacterized membrane protein YeaQ/YmgE (transglycosylase-associated protein family)|nr:integral rane protein [Aeromicrobium sp.]